MKKLVFLSVLLSTTSALADPVAPTLTHTEADAVPWSTNSFGVRWKDLIGADGPGQIPQQDLRFGMLEIPGHTVYPGHRHAAPELYYVISGRAMWTVGKDTFEATAGTTIYTPADTVHRMVNAHDEPVVTVWAWWAPGGDPAAFDPDAYEFTEVLPEKP
ncbi:MAG: cupin domain-containing protein [Pseudomonadaceae bacterium]|nr:cupin domain-containing protein [Pseudomonadaceae bacterium]